MYGILVDEYVFENAFWNGGRGIHTLTCLDNIVTWIPLDSLDGFHEIRHGSHPISSC